MSDRTTAEYIYIYACKCIDFLLLYAFPPLPFSFLICLFLFVLLSHPLYPALCSPKAVLFFLFVCCMLCLLLPFLFLSACSCLFCCPIPRTPRSALPRPFYFFFVVCYFSSSLFLSYPPVEKSAVVKCFTKCFSVSLFLFFSFSLCLSASLFSFALPLRSAGISLSRQFARSSTASMRTRLTARSQ